MKYMLIAVMAMFVFASSSCSNKAALAKIQEQIDGQGMALTDTLNYFTGQIATLQSQMDSLNLVAEAQAAAKAVRSGGSSSGSSSTTVTTTPPKDDGKIDVTVKGGGSGDGKIDVSVKGGTKGGTRGGKIDVSKKGGGN